MSKMQSKCPYVALRQQFWNYPEHLSLIPFMPKTSAPIPHQFNIVSTHATTTHSPWVSITLPHPRPLRTPVIIILTRLAKILLIHKLHSLGRCNDGIARIARRGAVMRHVSRIELACSVFGVGGAFVVLVDAFHSVVVVVVVMFIVSRPMFTIVVSRPIFAVVVVVGIGAVVFVLVVGLGACAVGVVGGGADFLGVDAVGCAS
mmetsp:Transcript_2838/g.6302  ORF Transcript_2838/g.6302 Transcript_2838/m.6302 type:complete len:203 (-) Transcript_2838:145-753(-)